MTLFPTYNRFNLEVESASGTIVKDINGKEYLDFGSGIGVCNLGHQNEVVKQAVEEQLNKYWHVSNLYKIPIQEKVAELITENSFADYVFFCNSGAEANEAAIKLARKVTGKDTIISFEKSFHGRTFATMAATGQDKIRVGFGSMLPTFTYAKYNDIQSVNNVIDLDTAAIMIELVQGEGGINPANKDFIQQLATICKEKQVLLIIDEIQTGIGRTGKKFAYEHYGITPDIMTLAKGLGNGLPVGAMVAKKEYGESFGPGSHGSTFGGNPLAMAAAQAVLSEVFVDSFLDQVEQQGVYLINKLQAMSKLNIKAIRHLGLMIGIECHEPVGDKISALLEKGLIVLSAGENVIRLLPPLIVTKEEIDEAVSKLQTVLE